MFFLYLMCIIPIGIGLILHLHNKDYICIKEWGVGSVASFIVAFGIHMTAFYGQVGDTETWSGKIVKAQYIPEWLEEYQEAIYKTVTTTDSNGNSTTTTEFSHYETRTEWHPEEWWCFSDIGTSHVIGQSKYKYFVKNFKNEKSVYGVRSTSKMSSQMIEGDPNDRITILYAGNPFIEPITNARYFENRVRATPSVFNFTKVPKDVQVYEYPLNKSIWVSDRVMGTSRGKISTRLWDEMNARLGPSKKVNVIIIGFSSTDSMSGEWQRSKWFGGKKNDIAICHGPKWVKVFGWTDSDVTKKNLESIVLTNPISNNLIPLIEGEIARSYHLKDFERDFAYLSVEPKLSHWLFFWVLMVGTQTFLYFYFHQKELFN